MHIPSARVQNEMANVASYLWFVPSLGSDTYAILVKAPTSAIKSIVKGSSVEFALGLKDFEKNIHISISIRINDDPVSPLIVLKHQRESEEHEALFEILRRKETPIFFFDELCRCVAWGLCQFEKVAQQKAIKLLQESGKFYVGGYNKALEKILDCFQIALDPSSPIEGADPIPVVIIPCNLRDISEVYISAVGFDEVHSYKIKSLEEGSGQEVNAWQVLESLFPFGIVRSPIVGEGTKERELTDILCFYELGVFLVESKALSIYESEPARTMERKVRVLHKHIRKAFSQFRGALNSIKQGYPVKRPSGRLVEFNREIPAHCIVLITELLQFGDWDEIAKECIDLMRGTGAMIHIIDMRELVALAAFSKSKEAFDYNLMQRFQLFVQTKNPFIRGIPKYDEA